MYGYAEAKRIDTESAAHVCDVMAEVREDVRGLSLMLIAMAEQAHDNVVEPEQLRLMADVASIIADNLERVSGALGSEPEKVLTESR